MIIYNPILGGKYIRELNLNIDRTLTVDKKKGLELIEKYPFLVDTDEPKYKPSYIDIKKTKNIEKTKKNIWHIIKSKIRSI